MDFKCSSLKRFTAEPSGLIGLSGAGSSLVFSPDGSPTFLLIWGNKVEKPESKASPWLHHRGGVRCDHVGSFGADQIPANNHVTGPGGIT